jgi:4-hydroxy-tetrahydrodipicolinate synthase
MSEKTFSGIFPYLVTPVDGSGNLKEGVLRDLVDYLVSKGIHGLTPLGSTGEGAYFPWEVKKKVVEAVVSAADGRVPVVAGVNEMTTHGAVEQAKETEGMGVDGILVVLPTYFPLADQQVVEHFRAVARAVACPVILYTNPQFAKWDFSIAMLEELAEEPNIRYLKDASGNTGKVLSIMNALHDRIKIFSASAHIPLFVFMLGGVGWMAGPACLIPEQCVALYTLAQEQQWEEALSLQKRLWSLNVVFQRYSLAACVKAGLEMQGFPVGPPLLPQRQLDQEGKQVVARILRDIGVLP